MFKRIASVNKGEDEREGYIDKMVRWVPRTTTQSKRGTSWKGLPLLTKNRSPGKANILKAECISTRRP